MCLQIVLSIFGDNFAMFSFRPETEEDLFKIKIASDTECSSDNVSVASSANMGFQLM